MGQSYVSIKTLVDVTAAAGILAPENSCMDSKVAGSNSEIPVDGDDTMVMVNYLGKGCESYDNESGIVKNVDDVSVVPTQVIVASIIHDPINKDYDRAVSKPRTALFRERENDEPMAPQVNISGDLSANNTKYPSFIKLGAFFVIQLE